MEKYCILIWIIYNSITRNLISNCLCPILRLISSKNFLKNENSSTTFLWVMLLKAKPTNEPTKTHTNTPRQKHNSWVAFFLEYRKRVLNKQQMTWSHKQYAPVLASYTCDIITSNCESYHRTSCCHILATN